VFLQGLAGVVREFLLAIVVVAVPGRLGGADALLTTTIVDDLDGVALFALALLFGLRLRGRLRHLGCFESAGLVGLLDRLQHDVRFEQLTDVRLQLESGQLQKADGLLQLRGHGQLLTQTELQGRFQHGGTVRR